MKIFQKNSASTDYISEDRHNSHCFAFTMVEILVSIAILMIMVLIITRIFIGLNAVWDTGTETTETANTAWSALGMMRFDLEHAVADSTLRFIVRQNRELTDLFYTEPQEISFASLQYHVASTARAVREIMYWIRENPNYPGTYQLMRGYRELPANLQTNTPENCYWNPDWYTNDYPTEIGILADHVTGFRLLVATNPSGELFATYDSAMNNGNLPYSIDICLELQNKSTSLRSAGMIQQTNKCLELIEKHAQRFGIRVGFPNRIGYSRKYSYNQ